MEASADPVPDQNTVREFREALQKAQAFASLFEVFSAYLAGQGLLDGRVDPAPPGIAGWQDTDGGLPSSFCMLWMQRHGSHSVGLSESPKRSPANPNHQFQFLKQDRTGSFPPALFTYSGSG